MGDNNGIGVSGLLGVLFIGLKLGHVIDWQWIWVVSPFWIPASVIILIISIAGLFIGFQEAWDRIW